MRKCPGKEAKLSFTANILKENHNGLYLDAHVNQASGLAERDGAKTMIRRLFPKGFRPLKRGG